MIRNFQLNDSQAVSGKDEYTYKRVIDDFQKSEFIGIMTFNISPRDNSYLISNLKNACLHGTYATVITNIPKRYPSYFGRKYALAAKDAIAIYMKQLNPQNYGMRLNPFFTFSNHAKVVMTDNIVYLGSSNFSDESQKNIECGTISTDKELINYLKEELFPSIQREGVPYYKYNIAVAIANIESLIPECEAARKSLFEAAYMPWCDYDTNFEDVWIYQTTESGITESFLENFIDFFSQFEDALNVIDDIVSEYWEDDELPDKVKILETLFEEYKAVYSKFYEAISTLFEELKDVARYDVSDEACYKMNDEYGMIAYDENLEYYAEKSMNEAAEEYEELIRGSEATVKDALYNLDAMIQYYGQLNVNLHSLLEVNDKIDNTNVN